MINFFIYLYLLIVFTGAMAIGVYRKLGIIDDPQTIMGLIGLAFVPVLLATLPPLGLGHLLGIAINRLVLDE